MNVQLLTDAAEMRYGLHPSLQEVHVVQLPKDAAAIPAVQAPIVQEGAAWSVVIPEVSPAQLRLTTYTSWPASSCRDFATVAATTRGTSLYRFESVRDVVIGMTLISLAVFGAVKGSCTQVGPPNLDVALTHRAKGGERNMATVTPCGG